MHSWSILGARMSHWQIQTHKTHHGLDLGEATTFPFIVYYVLLHETHIQMAFWFGTPTTLRAHNFVCRPPIEMRSKAKL